MAERRDIMKVKMPLSSVSFYLFVFTLLDVAVKSQMSSNSNSHTFIQDNSDVRYLVDNIPVTVHKEFSPGVRVQSGKDSIAVYSSSGSNEGGSPATAATGSSSGSDTTSSSKPSSSASSSSNKGRLKFEPSILDFKERHLGVPHHERVTILNLDRNKTIHMTSISGSTVHFHSSFFEDKLIPPLGNTSFNVVFLGREVGVVESCLFIHTSEGSFKYEVKGASIQSPYRLRPLSGVRLPLNASYSPLIQMHNPHATALQLVEVYSSGGEFHLELPSGELEGPKHLWEIPAFLTKPVIRVRFQARAQRNYTAYIRLKVNNSEEVLVVPLEVEVSSSAGLYCPDNVIDFGIGGSQDPPKQMKLMLHNSWKKPIRVQNVISTPVSKPLKIDFEPLKVPPDASAPTQVATLTFDWQAGLESGIMSGRIVVKSKQGNQKLIVPYTATVLVGGLLFDKNVTKFRSDLTESYADPRSFHITNSYKVPVAITNVTLQDDDALNYFQLDKFEPVILKPNEKKKIVMLSIKKDVTLPPDLKLESKLFVQSNISTLSVPLLCYDGHLDTVIYPTGNETELQLGMVGTNSIKESIIAVINNNPVPAKIKSWGTNLTGGTVKLIAIVPGNRTTFLSCGSSMAGYCSLNSSGKPGGDIKQSGSIINPKHYAVFHLEVIAGRNPGMLDGSVWIRTEFETIKIYTRFEIQHGSLVVQPRPIVFNNCFPGIICRELLSVRSEFTVGMTVTGVSSVPSDRRFSYTASSPLVAPSSTSHLGLLTWDAEEGNFSYLGINNNSVGWVQPDPGSTTDLPSYTKETDLNLLNEHYNLYINMSSQPLNLSLRLDTTQVKDFKFKASVKLMWPNLVHKNNGKVISFPLTEIGNISLKEITIVNPATRYSLLVQIVLENNYPMANGIIDDMPERLRPASADFSKNSDSNEFFVVTKDKETNKEFESSDQPILFSSSSCIHPHQQSLILSKKDSSFLIPPGSNISLTLGFLPTSPQSSSSLLFIRNNLTVLELVQLTGVGAYAQFKFGNRKPGSTTPLLFELADKHLRDCEREKHRKYPAPNLTVKRSFTARNTGALPITIHGFHISGLPCEGYGFRVLNCEPFFLLPNSTRKVDIAFTPDFTLARVQRTLTIWINNEPSSAANYTLVATLPPYLLASCSSVLTRPTWEPLLYYSAVTFMIFLLVCVLAAAFLESDRVLKHALLAMSQDSTVQPVLDLRLVAAGFSPSPTSSNNWSGNTENVKVNDSDPSVKKKLSAGNSGSSTNKRNSDNFSQSPNVDSGSSLGSNLSVDSTSSLSPLLSSSQQRRGSWSNLLNNRTCQQTQQQSSLCNNNASSQQKQNITPNNLNNAKVYSVPKNNDNFNNFNSYNSNNGNDLFNNSTSQSAGHVSHKTVNSNMPVVPILRTCDFSSVNHPSTSNTSSSKKNKSNPMSSVSSSSSSSSSSVSMTSSNSFSSNNNSNSKYKRNCLNTSNLSNSTSNSGNKRLSEVNTSISMVSEDADSSSNADSLSSHDDFDKEESLKCHENVETGHNQNITTTKYNSKQSRSNRANTNSDNVNNKKTDKNNIKPTLTRDSNISTWLEPDEDEGIATHISPNTATATSQLPVALSSSPLSASLASLSSSTVAFPVGNANKKSHGNNRNNTRKSTNNNVKSSKNTSLAASDICTTQATAGIHHSNKQLIGSSTSNNANRLNSGTPIGSALKPIGAVASGTGRNKDKSTPIKRKPANGDKNTANVSPVNNSGNFILPLPKADLTISPPPTSTARASFSDVVARTNAGAMSGLRLPLTTSVTSSLSSVPLSSLCASSDNMNIPMAPSSGLGPIGSKKIGRELLWLDQQLGSTSSSSSSSSSLNSSANIFGLDQKHGSTMSQSVGSTSCGGNWSDSIVPDQAHSVIPGTGSMIGSVGSIPTPCSTNNESTNPGCTANSMVLQALQEVESRQHQSHPLYKETWANVNSIWEPPSLYQSTSVAPSSSQLPVSSPVCPMWGSDVWAPPSAPWAPPGLTPRPQQPVINPSNTTTTGITSEINQGEYHPFRSLSNIWTPSPGSFWQPSTTK